MKKEDKTNLIINRKACIWLCRDLLPFSLMENVGFRDFWFNFNIDTKPPSRSTVSREALDDVYTCLKSKLIEDLDKTSKHGSIAFDAWTDRFRKHSYCTYTYHYMKDWTICSTVLKTARFDHPHTANSLKDNFRSVANEYSIENKSLVAITDGGLNMIKCLELLNIERIGCVLHSCNRLIVHDLMKNDSMEPLQKILSKLKKAQRKLCFKHAELKKKAEKDRQDKLNLMLEELSTAHELSIAHDQFMENEDIIQLEKEFSEEVSHTDSNFYGLHSPNPIRWGCLNSTITCFLLHQSE